MNPKKENLASTIPLDAAANAESKDEPQVITSSKIHGFSSSSVLGRKTSFKRPLNKDGHGATRIRTFHVRLSDAAMNFLDDAINEWLDENPDISVKFCNTVIGVFEGKRQEPHLALQIWY